MLLIKLKSEFKNKLKNSVKMSLLIGAFSLFSHVSQAQSETEVKVQEPLSGFLNMEFGTSLTSVKTVAESLGQKTLELDKGLQYTALVTSRDVGWSISTVSYIFPGHEKLGLVIEHYPDLLTDGILVKELTEKYGKPLGEKATGEIFEQIKGDLSKDLQRVTVWADKEDGHDRFVRVLYFGKYVSVEYLDATLMEQLES